MEHRREVDGRSCVCVISDAGLVTTTLEKASGRARERKGAGHGQGQEPESSEDEVSW